MLALGPLSAHFRLGESVQRNLICASTASNAGMLCSVSQGLSSLLRSVLLSVVVGRSVWAALLTGPCLWYLRLGLHQVKYLSFGETGFAQGHFPVNGTLRSLRWKSLIVEWTVSFLAPFVFCRQLELRPEPLRFWGLSSAVSTQLFRRPALTRINAIFTFITNQHSDAERGARVCMNDKLLNWTYLLWVREYPADISIMVVWVWFLYVGCLLLVSPPTVESGASSSPCPCCWVKSGSSTAEWWYNSPKWFRFSVTVQAKQLSALPR